MKRLAFLIAAAAMFTAGATDAQAHRGGYYGYGHGYGYGYGYGYYRPYYGAWYRSYPYYAYSPYLYSPFAAYVAPAYYGYRYPVAAPVYVQRPYVAVQPRAGFYAPPPRAEFSQAKAAPHFQRYTLSARELFEFDRSDLRQPQPKLDEIATALKQNPQVAHVTITGHTDRLGAEEYNQKLSERRAQAVKQYLVAQGVEPARLAAVGRGESQPVVQCNEQGQSALIKCLEPNRRVEVEQITIEQRQAARPANRGR
jgi:outer membrane protein OmpA-like peptidoglycan-associated protein